MGNILDLCLEIDKIEDDKNKIVKPQVVSNEVKITNEDTKSSSSSLNKNQEYNFYIDTFELTYKLVDNYGIIFQPKLIVKIDNYLEYEISLKNEKEKSIDNIPNNQSFSMSYIKTNKSYNFCHQFSFNHGDLLDIDEDYFSDINFSNLIMRIAVVNEKNCDLNGKPVYFGECKLPLYSLEENQINEFKIPVRNHVFKIIGYIYSRIHFISESILRDNLSETSKTNTNSKIVEKKLHSKETPSNYFDNFSKKVNEESQIFFNEYPLIPFTYLSEQSKKCFKLLKSENDLNIEEFNFEYDDQMNRLKILDTLTYEEFINFMIEAFKDNKQIISYEIFLYLNEILEVSDDNNIEDSIFFFLFKEIIKNEDSFKLFKTFPQIVFLNNNYHCILIYYCFIFKLINYFINHEIYIWRILEKIQIDIDIFCPFIIESFVLIDRIFNQDRKNFMDNINALHLSRETVLMLLNSLYLLINPSSSNDEEFSKHLYNRSYNNSIKIISLSKFIISVFIHLKDDTEISNLTVKIFKKSIKLCIDHDNKLLVKNPRNKVIANNIRISIVMDDKNSYFLTFLQTCLVYLKHYPELYINVLNILNQLSIDTNNKKLVYTLYRKTSFENLINSFDHYRWNLKNISKQINYQYYSFFYHLSSLLEENTDNPLNKEELQNMCMEINIVFKINEINGSIHKTKKLDQFLKDLSLDLYLIFANITYSMSINKTSCEEVLRDDSYLFMYIIGFSYDQNKEKIVNNIDKNSKNGKDIYSIYFNCLYKTLSIIENVLSNAKDYFFRVVNIMNIDLIKLKERINEQKDFFDKGQPKQNKNYIIPQGLIDNICNKISS